MNNDEIRKALEIIKEPITVNCIEYKYFDQENYDKITRVYDNCLWFANNLEQINLTVENLEKENKQLKADYGNKAQVERDILLQEKQELIDYLKKQIDICADCIDIMTTDLQNIKPRGNGKTYLTGEIFKNKIAKKSYEEILSKIEKR